MAERFIHMTDVPMEEERVVLIPDRKTSQSMYGFLSWGICPECGRKNHSRWKRCVGCGRRIS
jgi:hypothetical protein